MNGTLESAKGELKRADHLIFVSLKYTRTCDVIKHVIERLINCLDFIFTAVLEEGKEKGTIKEVPQAPIQKALLMKELFADDDRVSEFADFYLHLRKINKAEFSRESEFRRHVTMTVVLGDDEIVKIDIDTITSYFKKTNDFFAYVCGTFFPS
ncbi:hypothetical protein HY772_00300 [Candidatus Woesearchaeota archaeon]|nr:hypothetical protein [Candidatus Woesearchaeota archaeon]